MPLAARAISSSPVGCRRAGLCLRRSPDRWRYSPARLVSLPDPGRATRVEATSTADTLRPDPADHPDTIRSVVHNDHHD